MRTLLVDDQRLFREGLCALFREHSSLEVVGETASARQAYELVRRLGPQLVITELLLPGVDGVTAAREIRRLRPECKILVLTACKETARLQSAWLSGIDACVTKDESVETLLSAIASLRVGRRFVSPVLRRTGSALRSVDDRHPQCGDPLAQLSLREREVFDLVVRGFSTKQVAHELCISPKTVETHRAHINEKLAVHSTADLVRFAFRNELRVSGAAEPGALGGNRDGGMGVKGSDGQTLLLSDARILFVDGIRRS
jgi:two-component system, NarL family, response regulator NreC